MSVQKPCLSCSSVLPLEAFNKNARKAGGLDIYCKACIQARSAEHYQRNKEKRRLQTKAWLAKNPGKSGAYSLNWRQKNPGAQRASEARWYEKNRAVVLAKDKAQRDANREAFLVKERQSYERNRDARAARNRAWRESNPDRVAALAADRRAAKAQRTPPWLSDEHWTAIVWLYEAARIMTEVFGVEHHVDHIVPLRGKTVSGLHVPWNLQILTKRENLSKNNKVPE